MFNPLQSLRQQNKLNRHRALLILSGSSDWHYQQLQGLWHRNESVLWAGPVPESFADSTQEIKEAQYKHLLGQEADSIVIDTRAGFSANGLGILSGLIRAGGLLILLTADKSKWTGQANPENSRFLNTPYTPEEALPFFSEHLHAVFETQALWLSEQQSSTEQSEQLNQFLAECAVSTSSQSLPTTDQQMAFEQIHKVAFGHRKRPLVISADRGRGKTSALGIAAMQLLQQGKQHIVLTASRFDQASTAFTQALNWLQQHQPQIQFSQHKPGLLTFELQQQHKTFEFIAPDQLVLQPTAADVLMVDEAAHLPTPLLTELLKRHHRMVFATTLHGYEGSGRGFELRFKKTLQQLTPDWKNLHLSTPIRWAENDPLEQIINQALLLNVEQKRFEQACPNEILSQIRIEQITTETLAKDQQSLHTLFNLLVQAHYQTNPNDLQQLLSAPNLKIFIARYQQQPVGVALCIEEGKISQENGRLHGHLAPQLLKRNYSQPSFLMLSTWRVMRIAVHPDLQSSGIGKQLLTHIKGAAKQARVDYISSSFGATDELLSFWFKQGYIPLHVGVRRDKASGSHAVVVCQTISPMAQQALAAIQREFQLQFPHTLMESLPYLSASMVLSILKTFRFKKQLPHLLETLKSYQNEQRSYESISGQLWDWSIRHPLVIGQACSTQQAVWIDKVLKKLSWQEVAHRHHLAGRSGVEKELKALIAQTIKNPSKGASPYARVAKAY